MKATILFFLLLSTSGPAMAEPFVCPDLSIGETQEDCPWAGLARELIATTGGGTSVMTKIQRSLPALYANVQSDSSNRAMKDFWGESLNFDEVARATTIQPSILDALAAFFAVPAPRANVVHAGLAHTYGYLFSVLRTPYGFKRTRWVSGNVERGLGIPVGTLGPSPAEGTLFSNVTHFSARVAFQHDAPRVAKLERASKASPIIKGFKYQDLEFTHIEETTVVRDPSAVRAVEVALFTDLVMFPNATPSNAALLTYSVREGSGEQRLITSFPVDQAFVDRITKPSDFGDDKPIQARYNAYVKPLEGRTATGSRQLIRN
jgi:hypothetical protein